MSVLSDLEMTRLCAEAMGISVRRCCGSDECTDNQLYQEGGGIYRPLHDDAQAMALVKKLGLHICPASGVWSVWPLGDDPDSPHNADNTNLNRAIVQCVALMQQAKNRGLAGKI